MPVPVAVTGRGGPQPAKKGESPVNQILLQAAQAAQASRTPAPKPTSFDQLMAQLNAGVPRAVSGAQINPGPQAPWKPTADALAAFLQADQNNSGSSNPWDQNTSVNPLNSNSMISKVSPIPFLLSRLTGGVPAPPKTNDYALKISTDPTAIRALLNSVSSPEDLATKLGTDVSTLQPLFDAAGQASYQAHQVDSQIQTAQDQVTAQTTPPVTGAMSADSIDRAAPAVDPMTLATPAPLTAADYQQLILGVHAQTALQLPAQFDALKNRILSDASTAQARDAQITEAYKAGLKGAPLPTAPAPGESTAQSQYKVAGAQTPSVAPFNPQFGGLDTSGADAAILAAAGLVQQKQTAEAQYQLTQGLTDQMQQQAAAERQATSIANAEQKKTALAAQKASDAARADETKRAWAELRANEVVAAIGRKGVAKAGGTNTAGLQNLDGKNLLGQLTARFAGGERDQDVITAVFGPGVTSADLNVPALNLVQIAKVLAGGKVPPGLTGSYQAALDKVKAADAAAGTGGG